MTTVAEPITAPTEAQSIEGFPELLVEAEVPLEDALGRSAEVVIAGKSVALDAGVHKDCAHSVAVFVKPTIGFIHETDDPSSPMVGWQLRVDLQCGECGKPFTVDPSGESRDDGRGAVFTIQPESTE